jgi:hypothetical protein
MKAVDGERTKMSFWSALRKIFSLSGEDEAGLKELREKHGIDAQTKEEILREHKNEPGSPDYDPWDDIRNMRANFFLGSWVTRKFKFHPIGEEKLKRDLDKIAKKREEEEKRKQGEGRIE